MNMKTSTKSLSLLSVASFALTAVSCSTYEEGPNSSLVSKTNRLCREWQIDKYNGQPQEYNMTWEFEKDGDMEMSYIYYGYTYSYSRQWEWSDNKRSIKLRDNQGLLLMELDVIRLTTSEFWFEDDGNNLNEASAL